MDNPYNGVLAEIITSNMVGGLHLRRVGELLIAREALDNWELSRRGKPREPQVSDGWEFVEAALAIEDEYCRAWEECKTRDREWRRQEGLSKLASALDTATKFYRDALHETS